MAGVVAGLLTSAVVKIACDKVSSALAEQASLAWNFSDDLEDMKDIMESVVAVLKDAEQQSIKKETVRLWLKRLKDAVLDISDMMDDYHDTDAQSTAKMPGTFSFLTDGRKKMVLANKMKNMKEKLRKINEQGQNFNFSLNSGAGLEQQHYDQRETTSDVNEAKILGRDEEKKDILDILSGSRQKDGTIVFPIYGLGGMGKSTLAQLIYNDTRFKQYEHRLSAIAGNHHNTNTLQMIHQCLNNLLPGKNILIVLDDIWEEDDSELEKLKQMLHVGKKESMVDVIVTTRSESIAQKICTNEPHKIQPLKDDVCWGIIKISSGFKDIRNDENFEGIGLDIAKKCGGVALAAQALGYMLKSKDLGVWLEINNSDIWNESFGVDNSQQMKVLPSLKLSYERMLPILRLCFSYCAIFPKGHDIDEDDLVHEWFALDFIKKPSEGKEYIKQLSRMSFLQHSKLPSNSGEHVTRYTMHDLVHDLARSVIGDELIVIDSAKKSNARQLKYSRYALLRNFDGQTKLSNILPKKVRALHFFSSSKVGLRDGSFSFTKCLRILDFSGCSGILLPCCFGQLKQLRCLIAPKMENERLPDSVTELPKLQYLNLYGSSLISTLPELTNKLRCLVYLCLSGCSSILEVPQSLGELKSLMHLYMAGCSLLKELPGSLGNLTNLQHLDLSKCSNVKAIPESLCSLIQLQYLNLSSCVLLERIPGAIGSLADLRYLDMSGCFGIKELPESFANLRNLLHLSLCECRIMKGLPRALHGLTALQHLNLGIMLHICENGDLHDALKNVTNLKYLDLSLTASIFFGDSDRCISALTDLEHLIVCGSDLEYLPESIGNLKKLHTLDLSHCYRLKYLPHSISGITTLKSLLIEGCSDELIEQATSRLHYSLTLPLFKVRVDDVSACSNLPLLEGANVYELRILCLENVRSPEEAHKVKLLDKNKLQTLTLAWSLNADRFLKDENLLGQLVPPRGLKHLFLEGYNSESFPGWLMGIYQHLPNLVRIDLDTLPRCNNLPPLGQLPNLELLTLRKCPVIRKINKDLCGGKGAFPRLSVFSLFRMDGLEEWGTTYSDKDGEMEDFMFPVLDSLCVEDCPSLRLKPCPPTFHYCQIENSDQVICSLEELGNNIAHLTLANQSTTLMIKNSGCQSMHLFNHFPSLQELLICDCPNLTSLPESMRLLVSLQLLHLKKCDSISELPQWLGDLSSLKSLIIKYCTRVKSLPPCIQQLTELQALRIKGNPELKQWCESEENKKKLTHIENIDFNW